MKQELLKVREALFDFIEPINAKIKADALAANVPQVYFFFTRDLHFYERMEGRDINKGQIGSLFKTLAETKMCEMLCIITQKFENDIADGIVYTKSLCVSYKSVKIPFKITKLNGHYRLIPKTCLPSKLHAHADYYIEL